MAELPQSRLFFGPGERLPTDDASILLVLTMAGLTLPDKAVSREQWTTAERMAVPLLHLATHYTSRRVYGLPTHQRKVVGLDEVGQMADWGSGRAFFTRLGRDSRKRNIGALVSSQDPADVLGLAIANFISAAFVGRIEDDAIATEALRLLRVPVNVGYEAVLARLSPMARDKRRGPRDFVMKDVQGNVEKVRIDTAAYPALEAVLNTTAAPDEQADVA